MAGRQTGKLADKIWVSFKIFKIDYRLSCLGFYFGYYHCNVTTVLELYFSRLLSSKVYFKVSYELQKFGCYFFVSIPISY